MKLSQIKRRLTKNFLAGFALALGLIGGGLLAVAVTGTFNTFSSGSVMKAADINANFASLKAAIEGIPTQKAMRLIYETDVTSATTSVNITGLDGDNDIEYEIIGRFIAGSAAAAISYDIQPNGDTTTSFYRERNIYHDNGTSATSSAADTNTGLPLCGGNSAIGAMCFGYSKLFAKSGFVRANISQSINFASNSNWAHWRRTSIYTNTGTNITSLTIIASSASGIGSGSHIEVWARR